MLTKFPVIADTIIEWGIIFLLVSTPFAVPTRYGALHLWVYTAIELTIFLLVIIWLLRRTITAANLNSELRNAQSLARVEQEQAELPTPNAVITNRFGFVKTPLNIPIILFITLIIFQLIPLPSGVLKLLSPNTYDLHKATVSDGQINQVSKEKNLQPATLISQPVTHNPESSIINHQSLTGRSLSIYHYATKSEFLKILAYIGMFFLVTNTPGMRLDRLLFIIVSVGFLISFLGILQKFTGTGKIYWLIDSPNSSLFGPFINRNHFAGYIGMVIPLSFGLLISGFGSTTYRRTMTWHSMLTKFESHLLGNIFLVFAIMIMISALFLSLSRGGILSFIVTIMVFVAIIGLSRRTRSIISKGRKVTIATLFLAAIFLVWLGIGPVLERLSDLSSPSRHEVSQDTINMAKDFPLFGTGIGTFQYLFPKYKVNEDQLYWDHAHNDYVELFSDSGLIGFLLVTGGIIIFIWKILVGWWGRRDPFAKGVALGGLCGIIALLSHSVADFNMHIPANALFFSFLFGLTWNAVNIESTQMEE